ncbi:MgtC/SapB family protein [Carnimonas nigrificans]|uniref:MgtC/SapB family protein n=1 Tax=Carnimonas nigrificans TaxID=64323 RepID=UPI00047192E3|nr:MgtC/SapB family protein [Carnimonas nigrificans]
MPTIEGQFGLGIQLAALTLAFVLSALIGLEREIRHKSAGLRTCTVVGFSSALIMLVSKYGFNDMIGDPNVSIDPSRVAAQIVSGIGFIGGGVIFMRRDNVQGLTTAASVWLTSAIGMACGAGLFSIALFVTAGHFVTMLLFPRLFRTLRNNQLLPVRLSISYFNDAGVLGNILSRCTNMGFTVESFNVNKGIESEGKQRVRVTLDLRGKQRLPNLVGQLGEIDGVINVNSAEDDDM